MKIVFVFLVTCIATALAFLLGVLLGVIVELVRLYIEEKRSEVNVINLDKFSTEELKEIQSKIKDLITERAASKNPCIGCKNHWKQGRLDGVVEFACSYMSCKYGYDNARPVEAE